MPKDTVVTHPRPFCLYYGESRRIQANNVNFHLRTRVATLIGAVRAAIRRLHVVRDAERADVYDIIHQHMATVVQRNHGIEIIFTSYAESMHAEELRRNGNIWKF